MVFLIFSKFLVLHPDLCPFQYSACHRKVPPCLSLNKAGQCSIPEKFRTCVEEGETDFGWFQPPNSYGVLLPLCVPPQAFGAVSSLAGCG